MEEINDIIHTKYSEDFWDFKGTSKTGVHSIGKYPATMVADMQYELVKIIATHFEEKITLLDPFCGSGTSLVVSNNMDIASIGIDINPYAVLLSDVKTRRYSKAQIDSSICDIIDRLDKNINYELHYFENINKWFRKDIIDNLSKIKKCIEDEGEREIRCFFWVCFSEVVYKISNDRTSTFKLHAMTEEQIKLIKNTCINDFKAIIKRNAEVLNFSNLTKVEILQGNCIRKMDEIAEESISIICTSPPYGDNATTVTYGQFSILALKWMNPSDLMNEGNLLENYSKIDRFSLGGMLKEESNCNNVKYLKEYLLKLSIEKRQKVINFFEDYYLVFIQMEKVLKKGGYLLMTVGNRRVDGILQPLDKISTEIATSLGLDVITEFDRKILSKNMPLKLSHIQEKGAVSSMTEETVLIFKK